MNFGGWALVILLAYTAMQRIFELRKSALHASSRGLLPGREANYPAMVALHTSLFVLVPLEVWLLERPFVASLAIVSAFLFLAAQVLRFWVIRTLGSAWNVRIVEPDRVVSSGPYSFIRHPNYVAVVLEFVALPLFHTAWLSALFLNAANVLVLSRRIDAEEGMLMQNPGYRETMAMRPRFFPRLNRRK